MLNYHQRPIDDETLVIIKDVAYIILKKNSICFCLVFSNNLGAVYFSVFYAIYALLSLLYILLVSLPLSLLSP